MTALILLYAALIAGSLVITCVVIGALVLTGWGIARIGAWIRGGA